MRYIELIAVFLAFCPAVAHAMPLLQPFACSAELTERRLQLAILSPAGKRAIDEVEGEIRGALGNAAILRVDLSAIVSRKSADESLAESILENGEIGDPAKEEIINALLHSQAMPDSGAIESAKISFFEALLRFSRALPQGKRMVVLFEFSRNISSLPGLEGFHEALWHIWDIADVVGIYEAGNRQNIRAQLRNTDAKIMQWAEASAVSKQTQTPLLASASLSVELSDDASRQLAALGEEGSNAKRIAAIKRALERIRKNPYYPALHTHPYSIKSPIIAHLKKTVEDKAIFGSYAENNTPGAYRVLWYYSNPNQIRVLAIVKHID